MRDELDFLPEKYGINQVTLLVRDPHCLFAFWETDGPNYRLELYGTDQRGADRYLIDSFPVNEVGSRTIQVPVPGAHYVARLVSPHRSEVESVAVMTPPSGPSPLEDATSPVIEALHQWQQHQWHRHRESPISSHSFVTTTF